MRLEEASICLSAFGAFHYSFCLILHLSFRSIQEMSLFALLSIHSFFVRPIRSVLYRDLEKKSQLIIILWASVNPHQYRPILMSAFHILYEWWALLAPFDQFFFSYLELNCIVIAYFACLNYWNWILQDMVVLLHYCCWNWNQMIRTIF